MTTSTDSPQVNWADIAVISVLVGLFACAVGGTPVLMGVLLRQENQTASFIGLSAAMTPLGLITAAFITPRIAQRMGAVTTALSCALLGAALLLSMAAIPDSHFWLVARFAWGMAISGFYVVNKAWLAELTPASSRGRVIGIYSTVLAAGFSMGPASLAAVNFAPFASLGILAGALVVCAVTLLAWQHRAPSFRGKERVSVLSFIPCAPVLLLASAAFGVFDHVTLGFLPAYGAGHGVSLTQMGVAVAALNVGNVLLQTPIGWLADRFPRERILIGCALLTAIGALALPYAIGSWLLMPFLFVWGALAYGVATVAVALLGDHFQGGALLAGSAALTMAGGLGGIAGPPMVGAAIDVFGWRALPVSLCAAFLLLGIAVFFAGVVRPGSSKENLNPSRS
ncbi:MFS family permease [Variovorax paradoxus]|uniref:MFS transporter n=1 Tax=Variovorax paradoxus TaxID=34073 RepID=UPI00278DB2DC|nr:MFS transporter [Variovorax paradoxus]MDQ0569990.1 MFS family permease [Variovorax paradoxus]